MVNLVEEGGSDLKEEKDSSMQRVGGRAHQQREQMCKGSKVGGSSEGLSRKDDAE